MGPVLAAATLLAVIVGLVVLESKHPPPVARRPVSVPSSAQVSLERWQSPTDFLLDTPASELWRSLPQLTEPLPASPPTDSQSSKKGVPS
jgi:hypothetical protein